MRCLEDDVRALIVPNVLSGSAVAAASDLAAWLAAQGVEPVVSAKDAELAGFSRLEASVVPFSEIGEPDLAVALGGDGTILRAFHVLGEVETPILGIKFGRLGFLSGAESAHMLDAVAAALAGDAAVERRATISADVWADGRLADTYRAMNEVVVSRSGPQVISVDITVAGCRVASLRADGVVVATATGSTAYALSAGGPVVAPGHRGFVVVPIAPHTLVARAIVTSASERVRLDLSEDRRKEACVIIDGDAVLCRGVLEGVEVTTGRHDVSLVKYRGRDFYETVAEEFFKG